MSRHQSTIKVRGFHLDIYQHVNNARYLEFLEEARWAMLEDRGELQWFHDHGLAFVIVNININYRAAATMGQTLVIDSWFSKVGQRSAVVSQEVHLEGSNTPVADAAITFVCLDQKTGKPAAIEGELKSYLERHLDH